jgi:hypothetical protein
METSTQTVNLEPVKPCDHFCGVDVFEVDHDTYSKCMVGRRPYERWKNYVDIDSETGKAIRDYAFKNHKKSIILKDSSTSGMIYLKRK